MKCVIFSIILANMNLYDMPLKTQNINLDYEGGYKMNLVDCYTFIDNLEEAEQTVSDLNSKKSNESKEFYIAYYDGINLAYLVSGTVTPEDFLELKLEGKFVVMRKAER